MVCSGLTALNSGLPVAQRLNFVSSTTPAQRVRAPFRVSDAVRRQKVDGARTRGSHVMSYGDLRFARALGPWMFASKRTVSKADQRFLGSVDGRLNEDGLLMMRLRLLLAWRGTSVAVLQSTKHLEGGNHMPRGVTTSFSRYAA